MKFTVWTSWDSMADREPKCIFSGETEILPRVGDYLVCRDGFACEVVRSVSIDLVDQEAEISVESSDSENAYGPCLYKSIGPRMTHETKT